MTPGLRVAVIFMGSLAAGREAPAAASPVDLPALLEEARRVQEADVESFTRHWFRRRALREKLDPTGRVVQAEDLRSLVSPRPGSITFEERLLEVDGREPTPAEVSRHRQEARFTRHYRALREGEGREEQGGYSLRDLLTMSSYRYAGLEAIDDVTCHRLDFGPGEAEKADGIAGRFATAMEGSLWLSADGLHLRRAIARSVKPISIVTLLAKLTDLRLTLQCAKTRSGHWLPTRIEVWSEASVLGFGIRRHNLYEYADFTPVP